MANLPTNPGTLESELLPGAGQVFRSDAGAYYTFAVEDDNPTSTSTLVIVHLYKATSLSGPWTKVPNSANGILGSTFACEAYSTASGNEQYLKTFKFPDENVINLVFRRWLTGDSLQWVTYYMDQDDYGWFPYDTSNSNNGTSGAVATPRNIHAGNSISISPYNLIDMCKRGDGSYVALIHGEVEAIHGDDKYRIDVATRDSVTDANWTWQSLDAGGDVHYFNPAVIAGSVNAEAHLMYMRQTSTANEPPLNFNEILTQTINGNVGASPTFSTLQTTTLTTPLDNLRGLTGSVQLDTSGGTRRMVACGANADGTLLYPRADEDGNKFPVI